MSYDKDSSKLTFRFYSNDVSGMVEHRIATLVWYHVFVSWKKGESPFLVVNGAYDLWGSYSSVSRLQETYTHLLAGKRPAGGESDGGLSQVVIYKRPLSKQEMLTKFHCVGLSPGRFS